MRLGRWSLAPLAEDEEATGPVVSRVHAGVLGFAQAFHKAQEEVWLALTQSCRAL